VKVLVVNGSPQGERSGTMHLTRAFLEGASWTDGQIIDISREEYESGADDSWEIHDGV